MHSFVWDSGGILDDDGTARWTAGYLMR